MFARLTFIEADPRADAKSLEKALRPMLPMIESTAGCRGVVWLTDPSSGRCVTISFYEDRDALNDSLEAARKLTPELLEPIGGRLGPIQDFEVRGISRRVRIG